MVVRAGEREERETSANGYKVPIWDNKDAMKLHIFAYWILYYKEMSHKICKQFLNTHKGKQGGVSFVPRKQ